jgi:hypothetical protein
VFVNGRNLSANPSEYLLDHEAMISVYVTETQQFHYVFRKLADGELHMFKLPGVTVLTDEGPKFEPGPPEERFVAWGRFDEHWVESGLLYTHMGEAVLTVC